MTKPKTTRPRPNLKVETIHYSKRRAAENRRRRGNRRESQSPPPPLSEAQQADRRRTTAMVGQDPMIQPFHDGLP